MKPVAYVGSIVVAAALGAGACYMILHRPLPAGQPGSGAVVCPGNGACPNETKSGPQYYGFAVPHRLVGNRVFLCDGKRPGPGDPPTPAGCKPGYVGVTVMVRNTDKLGIKICTNGTAPCDADTDMLYCEVDPSNTNPGPCAVYAHDE